jgi:hypothetical protein
MIQRIQSLYLLISAISIFTLFFLPLATSLGVDDSWFSDSRLDAYDTPVMAIAVGGGLMAFLAIFLYGQRQRQLFIVRIAMLFMVVLIGYAAFLLFQSPVEGMSVGAGFSLPVLSLITGWFALKGIQKDDQIVKGMDRLR